MFSILYGQMKIMNKIFIFFLIIIGIAMINKVNANAYKFSFNSIDGKIVNLKDFKGKPILIINTASLCGFTNQYADIELLYDHYKEDGLIVIGIPSNDFGNQELSSNTKVKEFCTTNFDISFLLTEITKIKGQNGHPFFRWIKQEAGFLAFPKWNFYKYLINNKGELISWYTSTTNPKSDKIQKEVQKLIYEK